jgi:hypothetical protein
MDRHKATAYPTFALAEGGTAEELYSLFQRIGEECRASGAKRALLLTSTNVPLERPELHRAVTALSEAGCAQGFKLACVAIHADTFADFVTTQDAALDLGIGLRVFFDEDNAVRWLAA